MNQLISANRECKLLTVINLPICILDTKNCMYCSVSLTKKYGQSRKEWEAQKFCSYSCRSKYHGEKVKGIPLTEEVKKKISLANTGKVRTLECRKRLSERNKLMGLKPMLGLKHTEESKKKMSETHKKNPTRYWLGKVRSEETKRKISEIKKENPTCYWLGKERLDMKGENNWEWKGGISKERSRIWYSLEYKQWRRGVFLRDNFTCMWCGVKGVALEAHHIKTFAKYPELRFDKNNGITLCSPCHGKTKRKEHEFEELFLNILSPC